jgi:hypothetical protein
MSRAHERVTHHSGVRTRYARAKTARADGRVGSEPPRVVRVLVVVTVGLQQTKKAIARCIHTASDAARVAITEHQKRQIRTEATREESAIWAEAEGRVRAPCTRVSVSFSPPVPARQTWRRQADVGESW